MRETILKCDICEKEVDRFIYDCKDDSEFDINKSRINEGKAIIYIDIRKNGDWVSPEICEECHLYLLKTATEQLYNKYNGEIQ